jgi:hypothetical protein
MNLIKLQDYMNRLPPTPQTLQYLQAAANGQNPQIPPWVALTRMNEVQKALAQQAGQGEGEGPPSGTIKDKIAQASGVLATQQNQQQAAAQQMQAQQVRQGAQMPPQGGVQQLPPQPPAGVASIAPRMAYGGGIRGYAGGGGIASVHRFAGGGASQVVADPYVWEFLKEQQRQREEAAKQAEEDRKALLAAAEAKIPVPRDPNEIAMEEYRRMGIADPAAAYNVQDTRIAELQKRMAADEAKRAQEQDTSGRRGFYQSLIDAGEATRGRTGFSGLAAAVGGYGTAQNAADAAAAKDRRESEATLMRRQAELNELMSGVTAGRMGTAEKFATRGTGYADKRADIEATQQERLFNARKSLSTDSGAALRAADKDMTPIVGRMVGIPSGGGGGGANADAKLQLQELRLALQATQNNIKILQDDEKTAQKPGSYPTVQKQTEAIQAIRARRAAEEKRMADIQREIDKLSGPSTSSPTPTSGATPSSGTAPSPASSAQKFREQFPRTR